MAANNVNLSVAFNLSPERAIAYFRTKGYQITFDWHEMADASHATAFTVAKAARLDILRDIRSAVDSALAKATRWDIFKKNLTPLLKAKGWWGKQLVMDAAGNERIVQLGSAWRLKIISPELIEKLQCKCIKNRTVGMNCNLG